jgi:hypothetical protein
MLNSLPPAGIDQVRCDLDQHYEAIWNVFGGVPDLFHPPVFYSLDGIRLPLQDGKLATSPVEYFTRNYPGLQVAVVDAPLNDNWLSMTFIVPPGF